MGVGTTRTMDRIAAAIGVLDGAELSFEPADDIPNGGVLCALPALLALLALGLLRHAQSHITHPNGEISTLLLAERGTRMSNGLWLRELRRLDEAGHQSSILSTDYRSDLTTAAASMFARWNQENFFKYMRQHYRLDRLVEYGTSPLPDTTSELDTLKTQRKATPKHIQLGDLPPDQRIGQLRGGRKHFIDTIKLIAYRAETALVQLARETLKRTDDGRSFVRGLMNTTINLRPDLARKELRVELQGQANPIHDDAVAVLCTELNATETHYPGTELRLNYVPLRSPRFPGGQDV